ncbi:Phosphonate ABC transporter permease protein phnE1 [Rhodovulum sp. P5]|uniref:phosphonate ABC transporter, permease protein PhnE n=1 Tax=Rhodovulum sp. P5 TaxID=1564506 RepID=UPI0009C2CB62|nr:phosphonate ABC transporter, permease protein PhnE [Rhodovulum sp. P5]ARE40786.1 Phosphonate ABC transporter permease protein phnE1 [Rhodovulum sp. P5]
MSDMTADLSARMAGADRLIRRKRLVSIGAPLAVLAYLSYVFFAFDVIGLAERARVDNAMTLMRDTYSYKTVVSRNNRTGDLTIAKEGERAGLYPEGTSPDWVMPRGQTTEIDLADGHYVRFLPERAAIYHHPDFGDIRVQVTSGVQINLPESEIPDWISYSKARVDITTEAGRLTMTRAKTEVFRYFFGWELFWFTLDSPYHGHSVVAILFGPQIDPDRSNIAGAWHDFWENPLWHHAQVFWALGETILMAFLGTMGAALLALPLAFLAAKNFTPIMTLRFAVRRVFDFVRGVDALIFTILLSRAFGPGPMTGALAILLTDSGSFGKLFSEALENVDSKQIEGVQSTGAPVLARYRFGVIPQITPVLLSQVLYYLESNTRSATIIGAITGGGIGLMLTQAIITQKDWEEVSYYIVLIVVMVIFMDWLSGILRRRMIKGNSGG